MTKVLASSLAVLVLCACRSAQGRAQVVDARQRACTTGAWSAPRALLVARNQFASVSLSSIVRTREGVAFVGRTVVLEIWRDTFAVRAGFPDMLAGVLVRRNGRVVPIPAPPGIRWFQTMRAVSDRHGVAHLTWASGDTSGTHVDAWDIDTVWYAPFDGREWGRPEVVMTRTGRGRLEWNGTTESLAVTDDGRLYVAVPTGESVYVARRGQAGWGIASLPSRAFYTSLAAGANGVVLLATSDRWQPSVQVTSSSDGGMHWAAPKPLFAVDLPRGRPGQPLETSFGIPENPRLLVSDSLIYLVWAYGRRAATTDSVYLRASGDWGETWRSLPTLHLPGGIQSLGATLGGRGEIVAVGSEVLGGGEPVMAQWTGDQWRVGGPLSQSAADSGSIQRLVGAPIIAGVPGDSVYLSWGVFHAIRAELALMVGAPGVPVTMYATRQGCVASRAP